MKTLKQTVILSILLILSVYSVGCSTKYPLEHYDLNDIDVFRLEKGVVYFSMEIPSCFENQKIELREDLGYTDINFIGPGVNLPDGTIDNTYIDVFIHEQNNEYTDAKSITEISINATESLFIKDYQFIEKSVTTIDEILVYQYVYYRNAAWREYPEDPEPEPIPTIVREMCFEKNNMIWNILISSNQSIEHEAENILINILKSINLD